MKISEQIHKSRRAYATSMVSAPTGVLISEGQLAELRKDKIAQASIRERDPVAGGRTTYIGLEIWIPLTDRDMVGPLVFGNSLMDDLIQAAIARPLPRGR